MQESAAVLIILAAIFGVLRGADVRLVLILAAIVLGLITGSLDIVFREFLGTFSSEQFVTPICSAMGFAYVLKETECDKHLVGALIVPLRRVRFLLLPGVVVVGFIVNIPLISQTSTAVCLGTVVIPLLRAAGFSPLSIGAALVLGSSIGGELLNPGAPELLSVSAITHQPTQDTIPKILPIVLTSLIVSTLIFWFMTLRAEARLPSTTPEEKETTTPLRVNPLKAMIPLLPLVLLFLAGPPLNLISVPQRFLVPRPETDIAAAVTGTSAAHAMELRKDSRVNTRLIGAAMLVGTATATLVGFRRAHGCAKAFFDGAGYGFTHIVSLIVAANCFGKMIDRVGLAAQLGDLIKRQPDALTPLAGIIPMSFSFLCGSGMASTQSLYGFFYEPTKQVGGDPIAIGALVSVAAAAGRTISPVAAVVLMTAGMTGVRPFDLVKRIAPAVIAGIVAAVGLRMAGVI